MYYFYGFEILSTVLPREAVLFSEGQFHYIIGYEISNYFHTIFSIPTLDVVIPKKFKESYLRTNLSSKQSRLPNLPSMTQQCNALGPRLY